MPGKDMPGKDMPGKDMPSNDQLSLIPRTVFSGPQLEFDFPGLLVGAAEYAEGPTGCTVFYFPNGAATAIDIRGGSVGTTGNFEWNHAICLAGGSLYGLEAAAGVSAELFARWGYNTSFMKIALVSGAIIYDYGPRQNAIYPDKALGRAALSAVRAGAFPLGRHGAGCSATVGKSLGALQGEPSGQGGAFRQVGPTRIAVFSVVNAMGAILDRQGRVVRGHLDPATGARHTAISGLEAHLSTAGQGSPPPGNTTLTVLVTDQKLRSGALTQLARQVHTSLARAIQPFHTAFDGDTFYAVSTNQVDNPALDEISLGVMAAEVAWDAVLSIVA